MPKAQITYIFHSSFVVETAEHILVFDYYRDAPGAERRVLDMLASQLYKQVLVFASHGHGDHFAPSVFEWRKLQPNIHYVLSSDIRGAREAARSTVMSPSETSEIGTVRIETLQSTDLGVAYLVTCDGLTLFHAGDLNWWHWEGEPDADNRAMGESYKQQIDRLKGRRIDIAFIPVDPRLENHYSLGLSYFMRVAGANLVLPMHFAEDYTVFERLKVDLPPEQASRIVNISSPLQVTNYTA